MVKVNWLITDHNIVVNYDGQTHHIARSEAQAQNLISALKEKRFDEVPNLVSTIKRLESSSKGLFTVKNGEIYIKDKLAPRILGNKILQFMEESLPYEPLVKFAENLQKNPSFRATNELYQFLEKNNHPITENGNFIAYKKVRPNFKDIHSGTMDNSVGTTVVMPRNEVNEDPNQTCSYGLHVANWDYAYNHFGSRDDIMLEVEVHPADVVAVPVDYNQSKMRVCSYKVLSVVNQELSTPLRRTEEPKKVLNDQCDDDCDCEDEEDDEIYCESCGQVMSSYELDVGETLCSECEEEENSSSSEDEEASSSSEEEDEEEDNYPWEDELEDEEE